MLRQGREVLRVERCELCVLLNGNSCYHHIHAPRTRTTDVVEEAGRQLGRSAIEGRYPAADQITHSFDSVRIHGTAKEFIPCRCGRTENFARIDPSEEVSGLRPVFARAADEVIRVETNHCDLQASRSA